MTRFTVVIPDDKSIMDEALKDYETYSKRYSEYAAGGIPQKAKEEYLAERVVSLRKAYMEAKEKYEEDMHNPVLGEIEEIRLEAQDSATVEELHALGDRLGKFDEILHQIGKKASRYYWGEHDAEASKDAKNYRKMRYYYGSAHNVIASGLARVEGRKCESVLDAAEEGRKNVCDDF